MPTPARVLYVDDSRLDRELVRDALSQSGGAFQLTEAASQTEFEARLRDRDFDIVLSDFNICGFEGLHVIDAVRQHCPGVPVVIVTGTGSEEIAVEAMKRGAMDYVLKTPSHIQRLPVTLARSLERSRLETERALLERRLDQARRLESLGILAGGVAHDFNNLLTGVMGHLGLLQVELPPGSPALERVAKLEIIAEQAAGLCRQLLATSGRGRLLVAPVDLNAIVRDTMRMLDHATGSHVHVDLKLGAQLPATDADATQLRQVVMNLVTNAAEAIGPHAGTVTVTTSCRPAGERDFAGPLGPPAAPAERYVVLEISDTGNGISADALARVFDPFFSTKFTGHGLGLAAVLGIVRGHRGLIHVESELGRGTTFTVLFPARAQSPSPTRSGSPTEAPPVDSAAVVVIDDESSVRQFVFDALTSAGLRVDLFADGQSGLNHLNEIAQTRPLVLLDLAMPGMSGEDVLQVVKARWPNLPVVVMTGYADGVPAAGGLGGVLPKPFGPNELITAVRLALARAP